MVDRKIESMISFFVVKGTPAFAFDSAVFRMNCKILAFGFRIKGGIRDGFSHYEFTFGTPTQCQLLMYASNDATEIFGS